MRSVEDAVALGENTTSTTTSTISTTTTATPAAVVAATGGVGLRSLAISGEADPRALAAPTPASGGSNPAPSTGSVPVNNSNSANANPANMEQAEEFVKPIFKDGEIILEVECGQNKAAMYLSKLCQGSKGPCISFQGSWLTPNEFQFVSGRETAKDWKRSIRHHGKSLKLLLAKGILSVHPTMCDCEGCRIGAVLTRKGEKRRIPNGERKRKSTGNVPENSGNGDFRSVAGINKGQDGPPNAKKALQEKVLEANQSPLKESSMLNLPDREAKDASSPRLASGHIADAKMAADSRLASPVMPLVASESVGDINGNTTTSSSPEAKCAVRVHPEKQRHDSGHSESSCGSTSTSSDSVMSSTDVKVLSSSGDSTSAAIDKSLSRLALYHAASACVKAETVAHVKPEPDTCNSQQSKDVSEEKVLEKAQDSVCLPNQESKTNSDDSGSGNDVHVLSSAATTDCKDKSADSVSKHSSSNHSTFSSSPHEASSNHSSSSGITSSSSTGMVPPPSLLSPTSHKSVTSSKDSRKDDKHAHSTSVSASASASVSPHSKLPDKSGHHTTRHTSPERRTAEEATPKHPSSKPKDTPEKSKDRKQDVQSSDRDHHAAPHKESASRHSDRDNDRRDRDTDRRDRDTDRRDRDTDRRDRDTDRRDRDTDRRDRDTDRRDRDADRRDHREAEQRRQEERSPEKERKATMPGSGSRSAFIAEKHNAVPGTDLPGVGSRPEAAPTTDSAAFSEYMRVLAAGHHGLVPTPASCLPPMFPLRSPTDVAVSSAYLHPMHTATCGMFSTPSTLGLPKDHLMYPTSAAGLPTPTYGTPGLTPLQLLSHQYPAAATTPVLDYSRPYPYSAWPGAYPILMPDAMNAAAAAAAAANSSAKRSREEVDSAVDLSPKRFRLDQPLAMSLYGAGALTPADYMAAYRSLATPMSCGMESSLYDKNAEYLRKRLYPDLSVGAAGTGKGPESAYLASLPDYYRALYCCGCMENRPEDVRTWSVEGVAKFVASLEGCSVYAEIFREQRVDGKILVLLTVEHLMKSLGMKLGPAIMLTERVAKLLQEATRASGCDMCKRLANMVPALHSSVGY